MRWEAAEALGEIGDRRGVAGLILALEDAHPRVRQEAADALGSIGDPRALDALARC